MTTNKDQAHKGLILNLFSDVSGRARFNLMSHNHQVILASESYSRDRDRDRAATKLGLTLKCDVTVRLKSPGASSFTEHETLMTATESGNRYIARTAGTRIILFMKDTYHV